MRTFVMMYLLLLFNFNQTALPPLGYTMFNVIGTKVYLIHAYIAYLIVMYTVYLTTPIVVCREQKDESPLWREKVCPRSGCDTEE